MPSRFLPILLFLAVIIHSHFNTFISSMCIGRSSISRRHCRSEGQSLSHILTYCWLHPQGCRPITKHVILFNCETPSCLRLWLLLVLTYLLHTSDSVSVFFYRAAYTLSHLLHLCVVSLFLGTSVEPGCDSVVKS